MDKTAETFPSVIEAAGLLHQHSCGAGQFPQRSPASESTVKIA